MRDPIRLGIRATRAWVRKTCGNRGPYPGKRAGSGFPRANRGPVAERRLVSVLFADLVGFTPFAEERDAEDVREVLTRYFDLAPKVIGHYGGTVEAYREPGFPSEARLT